jgi:L,D-transpeptidase catalytic domain
MLSRALRLSGLVVTVASASALATGASAPSPSHLTPDGVLKSGASLRSVLKHPGDRVKLSDDATLNRWVEALAHGSLRREPRHSSAKVKALQFAGAQNAAEIYGVTEAALDAHHHVWLRMRIPGRPNGRQGWARKSLFTQLHVAHSRLVVDRRTLTITFYKGDKQVFRAPVGVGKASTPTPGGHFYIIRRAGEIFGPAFGPHLLFTNAYASIKDWPGGGLVGVHGTDQPELVPGRPSHGCVRMHNADITRLYKLVHVGTPLTIV